MSEIQTTEPTETQPPAKRKGSLSSVKELLEAPQFRDQIARALPKHLTADRFLRIAITASLRTPKLLECTPASLTNCLLQLSQLGLEPDGRRAHLIPFANNKTNTMECTLIVDYKGLAELAMRSGMVSNIHADVVRENDEFEYDRGVISKHKIDFRQDRGPAYAFYAICRFRDGTEKCDVMSVAEVEEVRKRSKASNNGPWVTDTTEMAKKTVFRRLSKWLPLSPDFRDALEADEEHEINITPLTSGMGRGPGRPPGAPNKPKEEATAEVDRDGNIKGIGSVRAQPATELPLGELTSAQRTLYAAVTAAGGNFDQFQRAAAAEEWDGKADDWTGFGDIPNKLAAGLATLPSLKESINAAKEGVA